MMIYTPVHKYYSEQEALNVDIEMAYNHGYGKGMIAQKQGPPFVPPKMVSQQK